VRGYGPRLLFEFGRYLLIGIDNAIVGAGYLNLREVKEFQDIKVLSVKSLCKVLGCFLHLKFGSLVGFALCYDLFKDFFARLGVVFAPLSFTAATEVHVHDHLFIKFAHLLINIVIFIFTREWYDILEIVKVV